MKAPEIALTLVSDRRLVPGEDLSGLARAAARAGVDFVQVREKDLPGRALRDLVAAVVGAVAGTACRVLVNGRPDVALLAGAHGVQLPEDGFAVADVKRAFPGLLVAASRHTLEGARRAEHEGADVVVLGPVFTTPGKQRALGIETLANAASALRVPVHAIGGIDARSAPAVVAAGAAGIAAIRVFLTGRLEDTVRALRGSR